MNTDKHRFLFVSPLRSFAVNAFDCISPHISHLTGGATHDR